MEKQTSIYLTDQNKQRLEVLKEVYETKKTNDVINAIIKAEYERYRLYNTKQI